MPAVRWTTGDEPMAGSQASCLGQLLQTEPENAFDRGGTKAEASRQIDAMQEVTGCGADASVSRS